MPHFDVEKLYLAIVDCANKQCQKKCGKIPLVVHCSENNVGDICKTRVVATNAKNHFEQGLVGLLKNDLKIALALNK